MKQGPEKSLNLAAAAIEEIPTEVYPKVARPKQVKSVVTLIGLIYVLTLAGRAVPPSPRDLVFPAKGKLKPEIPA
jgi:hypothetical protein